MWPWKVQKLSFLGSGRGCFSSMNWKLVSYEDSFHQKITYRLIFIYLEFKDTQFCYGYNTAKHYYPVGYTWYLLILFWLFCPVFGYEMTSEAPDLRVWSQWWCHTEPLWILEEVPAGKVDHWLHWGSYILFLAFPASSVCLCPHSLFSLVFPLPSPVSSPCPSLLQATMRGVLYQLWHYDTSLVSGP